MDADLEVQMGAGRHPGGTHEPDDLSGIDVLTDRDEDLALVCGDRGQRIAVVDDDAIAVPAAVAGHDHYSGGGCVDRRARAGGEVEAGVEPGAAAERIVAEAERRAESGPGDGLPDAAVADGIGLAGLCRGERRGDAVGTRAYRVGSEIVFDGRL